MSVINATENTIQNLTQADNIQPELEIVQQQQKQAELELKQNIDEIIAEQETKLDALKDKQAE